MSYRLRPGDAGAAVHEGRAGGPLAHSAGVHSCGRWAGWHVVALAACGRDTEECDAVAAVCTAVLEAARRSRRVDSAGVRGDVYSRSIPVDRRRDLGRPEGGRLSAGGAGLSIATVADGGG